MDLETLTIPNITKTSPPSVEAEIVAEVCSVCECEESKQTAQGICSICGVKWLPESDDNEDDFAIALNLLSQVAIFMEKIFNNRKIVRKLSYHDDLIGRDLAIAISEFVEMYND